MVKRAQLLEDATDFIDCIKGKFVKKEVTLGQSSAKPTNGKKRPFNITEGSSQERKPKVFVPNTLTKSHCKHCDKLGHTADECLRKADTCLRCGSREHCIPECPLLKENERSLLDHRGRLPRPRLAVETAQEPGGKLPWGLVWNFLGLPKEGFTNTFDPLGVFLKGKYPIHNVPPWLREVGVAERRPVRTSRDVMSGRSSRPRRRKDLYFPHRRLWIMEYSCKVWCKPCRRRLIPRQHSRHSWRLRQEGEMEQYLEEKKASQKRPAATFQWQDKKKTVYQTPQRSVAVGSSQRPQDQRLPKTSTGSSAWSASPIVATAAPATGRLGRPQAPARVFALAREDAEQAEHVTEGEMSSKTCTKNKVQMMKIYMKSKYLPTVGKIPVDSYTQARRPIFSTDVLVDSTPATCRQEEAPRTPKSSVCLCLSTAPSRLSTATAFQGL
ncbi:hypothetical protein Taro_046721 [Colocasia esculenta]|uniref:CCHC-type domain-containing protein n=1 Tax=Colocasia esculenta TaxID=4460 RepID=A0A843X5X2_COLES|nr:hypothetical protein [Colocasia esculenta]